MNSLIYYVCLPLGYLMRFSQLIISNYGLAIILFTLLTKVILLPLAVWIQQNSILMVKIQPEINFLKARLQGNADAIAEEQSKLFKREHYHPLLSLIPLLLQVFLLLAVVAIIYHPLTYLYGFSDSDLLPFAEFLQLDPGASAYQLDIIEAVKAGQLTAETTISGTSNFMVTQLVAAATKFKINFLGFNLSAVPASVKHWYLLVPVFAGLSSWVLCYTQNRSNVLQHEQSKWNQYGIMGLSVALSLYLGLFVPAGIALYWIASNLFSVLQMYLLNVVINPKKHVDYQALAASREELAKAKEFGKVDKKDPAYKENKIREKRDYQAFMKVVNKHIVFYSEKSGFYKYYEKLIAELLRQSNVTIHYVTNDPQDIIFKIAETEPRIRPYYIGLKKLTLLMMLVSTDMFIMSTPDLDKYYLKRSFLQKDIEYVYVPHDMMSVHLSFNDGAFDAFDTMLCTGPHVVREMQKIIELRNLKPKHLVEFGYPLADELAAAAQKLPKGKKGNKVAEILVAPSWQEDNLLDSCIDQVLAPLLTGNYHVTVRPHPEYVKRYGLQLQKLMERYATVPPEKLIFELDFAKNSSIYSADLLITDWSGVGPEFCFATKRPALFINTKMKCLNPNWQKLGIEPVEIALRQKIGKALDKEDLNQLEQVIVGLLREAASYREIISQEFQKMIFNHGTAAKVGARYLLQSIAQKKIKEE